MIGFVRGLILVLTSLAAAAGVVAIKRGTVWSLQQAGDGASVAAGLVLAVALGAGWAWVLLRPVLLKRRLQREQRAEDAGVRQLTVGHRPGDR